jgi:hypothetical protein
VAEFQVRALLFREAVGPSAKLARPLLGIGFCRPAMEAGCTYCSATSIIHCSSFIPRACAFAWSAASFSEGMLSVTVDAHESRPNSENVGPIPSRGGRRHQGLSVHGDVDITPAGIPSHRELREEDAFSGAPFYSSPCTLSASRYRTFLDLALISVVVIAPCSRNTANHLRMDISLSPSA